ncbi:SRPBCC domain-containing protein [Actinophytocola sp.]|uniref:SRPBCC family protein n=1 Tax=Actinophytocola sp. TaxID=1872138 RepID=UPI002ED44F52
MATITLVIEIDAPAERVFEALVDLPGYGRWLSDSTDYAGTTKISTDPVTVGTTYVERSRTGVRRGTVTELAAPTRVTFHQPMTMRPRLLGVIDIRVTYTLSPVDGGVRVERVVTADLPWQLKPVEPLVLSRFRRESRRTIDALKAFAE